ncbi:MAG: STAS domain-containing protein [Anaerolineales bacterium]
MEISQVERGDVIVLEVAGSVDALTVDELVQALDAVVASDHVRLVGDIAGVDYMSSAGLRAILSTLKACRGNGGDFRLASPTDGVHSLLEISGFTSIVQIFDDVDSAVVSFDVG